LEEEEETLSLCCDGSISVLLSKEGGSILGKEVVCPKCGHVRKSLGQWDATAKFIILFVW